MHLWVWEAVAVLRQPGQFFEEHAPHSILKAVLFLLVSGVLVSLTHYALHTSPIEGIWWTHPAYIAGPLLVGGTVVLSILLHGWLYIDRWLGEKNILFDKLPLDYSGRFTDTFVVFAYASAVPAVLLWAPILLAPSIPALVATLLIGAYTGYVAAHGFARLHELAEITEEHDTLLTAEVFGGSIVLFIILLIVLVRPVLVIEILF